MQRGVLTGILLGSVVSIAILAALSLSTPLPGEEAAGAGDAAVDEAVPVQTEAGLADVADADAAAPDAADTEVADAESADAESAAQEDAVAVETPPADPGAVETALAAPSDLPQVSGTDGARVGGAQEAGDASARAATPTGALPQIEGARDTAPLTDTAPAPEPAIGAAPASPEGPDLATGEPRVGGGSDADPAAVAPAAPSGGAQATAPQSIDTTTPAAPAPEIAADTTEGEGAADVGTADGEVADGAAQADAPDRIATLGRTITGGGTQPERASSFIQPTAPEGSAPGDAVPETGADGGADGGADTAGAPEDGTVPNALRDNAQAFEAPEAARAFMAVVLIDDPEDPLSDDALARIGFPVTFAIDPLRADAGARAETLRAAGHEVVILGTMIPSGATSADTDAALMIAMETLPQAVAVLDTVDSRIQGDRVVLAATVDALGRSGHGLVTLPRGLNPAEAMARRADLPAATAYRTLDQEDERATVITRSLTRAAIAASQQDGVVVIGRTRPDTITALLSWSGQREAESVTLAPVSAVLLQSVDAAPAP